MASGGLHISISAEPVFHLGPIAVSNSILTTWLVTAFIFIFVFSAYAKIKKVKFSDKPTRFQSLIEMIIEALYNLVKSTAGTHQKARAFFPLVSTFFLFIILSNWSGLLPGVGSIGFKESVEAVEVVEKDLGHGQEEIVEIDLEDHQVEAVNAQIVADEHQPAETMESHDLPISDLKAEAAASSDHSSEAEAHSKFVPYFRGPTADLNTTLALAVFSIIAVQVIGFKFLKFEYPKKFINLKSPIDFFVGILEIFSEVSRIISFAFRLFGNIFAGEVLLTVIAFLMPILAPLPFLGLEIFVGFIQALVFSMLTLVFLNIATLGHSHEDH